MKKILARLTIFTFMLMMASFVYSVGGFLAVLYTVGAIISTVGLVWAFCVLEGLM